MDPETVRTLCWTFVIALIAQGVLTYQTIRLMLTNGKPWIDRRNPFEGIIRFPSADIAPPSHDANP